MSADNGSSKMQAPHARCMRSDQRGSSLIEFALILPFLLVITFAVVDLSHALVVRSVITSAAREGARRAIELSVPQGNGRSPSAGYYEVYSRVTDVLTPAGVSFQSLDVSGPDASHNLTVTVSANFTWLYFGLLNFFGPGGFSNPQTLTATAVMRKIG
jgi:Flp pilus assembly protein TadG